MQYSLSYHFESCQGRGVDGGSSPSRIVASSGRPFQRLLAACDVPTGSALLAVSLVESNAFSKAFSPLFFKRNDIADLRHSMYESYLTISVSRYWDLRSQLPNALTEFADRGEYYVEINRIRSLHGAIKGGYIQDASWAVSNRYVV